MNARSTTGLALLLTTTLLSGCGAVNNLGGERGGWANEDMGSVSGAMASDPEIVDDGLWESDNPTIADSRAGDGVQLPAELVHPRRFWRNIRHVERRFEFVFSDSDSTGRPRAALVTMHKDLTGTFNILADSTDVPTDSLRLIRKDLADHWVRRILVKREALPESLASHLGRRWVWRVVASSAVEVT